MSVSSDYCRFRSGADGCLPFPQQQKTPLTRLNLLQLLTNALVVWNQWVVSAPIAFLLFEPPPSYRPPPLNRPLLFPVSSSSYVVVCLDLYRLSTTAFCVRIDIILTWLRSLVYTFGIHGIAFPSYRWTQFGRVAIGYNIPYCCFGKGVLRLVPGASRCRDCSSTLLDIWSSGSAAPFATQRFALAGLDPRRLHVAIIIALLSF